MRSLPLPLGRLPLAVMLLLALPACTSTKDDASSDDTTTSPAATDLDGDGYGGETDCDDSSAGIYPGAEERCNNLDDNCDGQVDEDGVVDGIIAYADGDGDGWGADVATTICPGLAGYLYSSGDCDDSTAGVNPAATELCDSVDNDCDGLTDEPGTADGSTYYLDQDGDGYGHPVLTGTACAPGDGYVENNTDCDDGDPARNPGEPELCNDDVDNDCDGETDEADAVGTTWYGDVDGDAYGDDSVTTTSCDRPEGYVHADGDCDDSDPDINPDACDAIDDADGVDNDCSGVPDDSDSCGDNTGVATYVIDDGSTSCKLVWDNVWNPISSMCDDCIYGWDVSFAFDDAASENVADCGGSPGDLDWEFSFDEDYEGYGSVLWYYYGGYDWYPVWLATLDASGHLEWDATYAYDSYRYGWYGYADLDL